MRCVTTLSTGGGEPSVKKDFETERSGVFAAPGLPLAHFSTAGFGFKRSMPEGTVRLTGGTAGPRLLELSYLLQDLFVRCPDGVICFGKFPAHYALFIDHVSGWMRPAFAVRVENPIAINHFVVGILKQGKGLAAVVGRLKFLAQFFRVLMTVDAHRENLRLRAVLFV